MKQYYSIRQWIHWNVLRKGFDAVNSFSAYLGGFSPLWNQSNLHIFSNREIGKHLKHLWNNQQFEEYLTSNFLKKSFKSCLEDSSSLPKPPATQLLGHYNSLLWGGHPSLFLIIHRFGTGLDSEVFHDFEQDAMIRFPWKGLLPIVTPPLADGVMNTVVPSLYNCIPHTIYLPTNNCSVPNSSKYATSSLSSNH